MGSLLGTHWYGSSFRLSAEDRTLFTVSSVRTLALCPNNAVPPLLQSSTSIAWPADSLVLYWSESGAIALSRTLRGDATTIRLADTRSPLNTRGLPVTTATYGHWSVLQVGVSYFGRGLPDNVTNESGWSSKSCVHWGGRTRLVAPKVHVSIIWFFFWVHDSHSCISSPKLAFHLLHITLGWVGSVTIFGSKYCRTFNRSQ
jgi:hypothetical protein